MKNIFLFFECSYKNMVTRIGFILIFCSVILFLVELITLSFIFFIYGMLSLLLSGFGRGTYFYCKRTYNNLLLSKKCTEPYKYCFSVGYKIALKKYKRLQC